MWFELKPVGLDFLESAPRITVVECHVDLPRHQVWEAVVDAPTWSEWWPGVRSASYAGAPPYGVGTRRIADVGGWRMEETMLAWDPGRRWAYRIDRSTAPLARAQLESTELEDHGAGTTVRWTLAAHPGLLLRITGPFFQRTVQRMLERAMRNLEARARAAAPSRSSEA
jgi:carbon monoxide dehydrogenase subunit G